LEQRENPKRKKVEAKKKGQGTGQREVQKDRKAEQGRKNKRPEDSISRRGEKVPECGEGGGGGEAHANVCRVPPNGKASPPILTPQSGVQKKPCSQPTFG